MKMDQWAITKIQAVIAAVIIIIGAIIVGVAYYYTLPPPTPTPTPAPPLKIGYIAPLTGASAYLGKEQIDGALIALEEINAMGGILGRRVELIIEDDEGNPDKCLSVAKKLVELDRVDILVGVLHSGNVVAISEYVASTGIPYISATSSGPCLVYTSDPKKFRNFFTIHPYYDDCGKLGLKFLAEVVKAKTFVVIREALTWSIRSSDFLELFAADMGIKCLNKITVPAGCKDFSDAIMKVREANADALVFYVFTGAEVTLIKQLYENRLPIPYCGVMALAANWPLINLIGEASDYLCFGTWSWNTSLTEKTVPFFNKFYKKYGYRSSGLEGPAGYDVLYLVKSAIEKAGTLEREAVIKALEEVEVSGVRGKYKIDLTDHGAIYWAPGYINGVIGQWKKGKAYVIWPPDMAEKSFEKAPWMP